MWNLNEHVFELRNRFSFCRIVLEGFCSVKTFLEVGFIGGSSLII